MIQSGVPARDVCRAEIQAAFSIPLDRWCRGSGPTDWLRKDEGVELQRQVDVAKDIVRSPTIAIAR